MNDKPSDRRSLPKLPASLGSEGWPKLEFKADDYRAELKGCGYSKEQEDQLLQALWDIMSTMVYMDWGLDSIHLILPEIFVKAGSDSDKLVNVSMGDVSNDKPLNKEGNDNE